PGDRVVARRVELGDRGGGEVVEPGGEQPGLVGAGRGPDADVQRRPALHPKMSFTRSKNGLSPESRSVWWTSAGSTRLSSSIALRCSLESFFGTLATTETNRSPCPRPDTLGRPFCRIFSTVPLGVPSGTCSASSPSS